jgi:hypothetical protein
MFLTMHGHDQMALRRTVVQNRDWQPWVELLLPHTNHRGHLGMNQTQRL